LSNLFNKIKLTNFRNATGKAYDFSEKINLIVGRNGIGKTNILDGIYYLASVRSNSNASDALLVRQSQSFFRLEGWYKQSDQALAKIVLKCQPGLLKELEWNGSTYSKFSDHIGKIPIVFIGPDDIDLIKGSAEQRRKFMDFTLSVLSKDYLLALIAYNKYLKQRMSLVKQERPSLDLLRLYDEKMEVHAALIHAKRREWVQDLSQRFGVLYRSISNLDSQVGVQWVTDMEGKSYKEVAAESQAQDLASGRCLKGPHRDDLAFFIQGREARKTGSQGQLKSFLLALKFSQYHLMRERLGLKPILLLDDIFDRLDTHRVKNLINLVGGEDFGQVFISDTQSNRIKDLFACSTFSYSILDLEEL
jgi:DNA replication and repair protein RecF